MDDYKYTPKPLELITPDTNYKIDERILSESMKRNKKLIDNIRKIRESKGL